MKRIVKKFPFSTVAAAILLMLVATLFATRAALVRYAFAPTDSDLDLGYVLEDDASADSAAVAPSRDRPVVTVAEGMHVPWEVAFLADGGMIATERDGRLWRDGNPPTSVAVPGVVEISEGGLLGLAVPPGGAGDRIYLYYTARAKSGAATNRVSSFRYADGALSDENVVVDGIPAGNYHDGGRIAFGPDGKLYVTTGDAGDGNRSQDKNSLAGKILRVNPDGSVPEDNPFGNAVWSYGHRNPQGLAWDDRGRLWATEHGRSGAKSGLDELNLIVKGGNYGWPVIEGDKAREGMILPVRHSGEKETWAPSGMAFADGSLWFAGLRGSSLYQAEIADDGGVKPLRAHLRNEFGRLRAVVRGPDGALYVSTSNDDGRGTVRAGDDRILRVIPSLFNE